MGVGVDEQLHREDNGEECVELLQPIPERGGGAVVVDELLHDLRLRRVDGEVLRAPRSGIS